MIYLKDQGCCVATYLQECIANFRQMMQEGEGEAVKKRSFRRSKSAEEQARRIKERNRRAQQVVLGR